MAPSLIQVVLVSMIKDAYEEYKKQQNDAKENNAKCQVFDQNMNKLVIKTWKQVFCGDIIKLDNDQPVPADLLVLTTSDEKGIAYVETKNLDGETNLKEKRANKVLLEHFESRDDNQLF